MSPAKDFDQPQVVRRDDRPTKPDPDDDARRPRPRVPAGSGADATKPRGRRLVDFVEHDPDTSLETKPSFVRPRRPIRDSVRRPPVPDNGIPGPDDGEIGAGVPDPASRDSDESYVRLRVAFEDHTLSLLDSHVVRGPLHTETVLLGGHAYDVVLDGRLLNAGALPDLTEERGFGDPRADDDGEEHGHRSVPVQVPEFHVRIPAAELTPDTLANVQVRLFALSAPVFVDQTGPLPLDVGSRGVVDVAAVLSDLPTDVLPEVIERRGDVTGRGDAGER